MFRVYGPGRREDQPDEDIMFRSMVQVEERISQMKTLCLGSMVQVEERISQMKTLCLGLWSR